MTAEIFLAVFLASMLVAAVQWVFVITIYHPLQRWLANRAWEKLKSAGPQTGAMFNEYPALPFGAQPLQSPAAHGVGGGLDLAVPSDLTPDALRSFNACVTLQMAALAFADNPGQGEEDGLRDASLGFRIATTPTRAKELREMAEFHRAMQRKSE